MSDNQVGSVYIRVRPDASGFRSATQADVRRELAGYRAEVPVHPDLNESQMRQERRQAQNYYDRNPLEVDVNADFDRRLGDMEDAFRRMGDRAEETRQSLSGMRRDLSALAQRMSNMEVSVSADDIREIRNQVSGIEAALVAETSEAARDIEQFKTEYGNESLSIDLEAEASLASVVAARQAMSAMMQPISVRTRMHMGSFLATQAQLATLGSRPRHVDIIPRVPMRAWLRLEAQLAAMSSRRIARLANRTFDRVWRTWTVGGFRSLAGLGDMDKIMESFDNAISQLDVKGSQAVATLTAIGTAANVAGDLIGGLVVTLADLSRVAGLAAAAPSLLLAGLAGLQTHRAIWGDFRTALDEVKEEEGVFESLPENAQRAVLAIDALNRAINKSVQDGFWEVMTDEITRFAETVGPVLERGMGRVAEIYADTLSGMLDLAQVWAEGGELGAAFTNINRMFEGVGAGIVEIFDAFVTVGMRASGLLPRLGHEFENLGRSINNYLQWASEMGHIERWIADGVRALSDFLRVGGAVARMAHGLTQAFRNAGAWGLPELVAGLERAGDLMQSQQWQYRMGNIFSGMVEGAGYFWSGFAEINSVLYESHEWLRQILVLTGQVAEAAQFRFADVIGNERFQLGGLDLFEGALDMLDQLEPAADSLGNILGHLGSIVGEILREMAPGINTLMGIFSDLADIIGPAVVELTGPLTEFIENLGHTVRHNVNTIIGPALRGLIELFMALPAPIQQFLTLGAVMARWLPAFGQAANRALLGMSRALQRTNRSIVPLTSAQRRLTDTYRQQARVLPGAVGALTRATQQYERTGPLIRNVDRSIGGMFRTIRDSQRQTAAGWRDNRNAMNNTLRAVEPMRTAYARVGSAVATTQTRTSNLARTTASGIGRATQTVSNLGTRFIRTAEQIDRAMPRIQRNMDAMQRGFSTRGTGIPRGLNFNQMFPTQIGQGRMGVWQNMQNRAFSAMQAIERRAGTFNTRIGSIMSGMGRGFIGAWAGLGRGAVNATRTATTAIRNMATDAPRRVTMAVDGGINRAWDGMARVAGTAARNTVSTVSASLMALPGVARTAATGMSAAFSTAFGVIRTAATAAAGVVRSAFALIGGLPGLLLVGTISAISQVRARAAEAEQQIQGMRDALDQEGPEGLRRTIEQVDGMAEALVTMEEAGIDTKAVMDNLVEGGDMQPLIDDLETMRDALQQGVIGDDGRGDIITWANGNAEEFMSTLREVNPQVARLLENLNFEDMSDDERRGVASWADDFIDDLREVDEGAQEARRQVEALRNSRGQQSDADVIAADGFKALNDQLRHMGEGYAEVTGEAEAFANAVSAVGDETSTMESRVQGASQAMRELRGDYSTFDNMGVEVWDRQQNAIRTLSEAQNEHGYIVGDLKEAYDDQGNALGRLATDSENMSEVQRVALQGVSEAHEHAMAAGVEAYQQVMDAGGSATEAVEAGRDAYQNATGDLRGMAEEAGFTGENLELLVGHAEHLANVDDFEFVLTMSGLDSEDIAVVYDALNTLEGRLDNFDEKEWQAFLAANADQAYGVVNGYEDFVIANFEARQFMTNLGAMDEEAIETVAQATGTMQEYEKGYYAAVLTAALEDDEVREKWPELEAILDHWEGGAFADIDMDTPEDDQIAAMENLTEALERMDDTFRAILGIEGDTAVAEGVDNVQGRLETYDLTSVASDLGLNDHASGLLDEAQGKLVTLDNEHSQPDLALQAAQFFGDEGRARELITQFPDGSSILDMIDNASEPARMAELVMRAVVNGNYDAMMSAIRDQGSINSVEWALNNLARNRTSTITTRRVTSWIQNSMPSPGGVWNAGGNLFSSVGARGYKAGFPVQGKFKAFANGGFENHTAQITSSSGPVRVWSEPETGGEAYIPLAASKRARSTEIWRETGRRLGATSGGDNIVNHTEGGTVNLTVNYPQAEPTSHTVQRAMDYLGAGG